MDRLSSSDPWLTPALPYSPTPLPNPSQPLLPALIHSLNPHVDPLDPGCDPTLYCPILPPIHYDLPAGSHLLPPSLFPWNILLLNPSWGPPTLPRVWPDPPLFPTLLLPLLFSLLSPTAPPALTEPLPPSGSSWGCRGSSMLPTSHHHWETLDASCSNSPSVVDPSTQTAGSLPGSLFDRRHHPHTTTPSQPKSGYDNPPTGRLLAYPLVSFIHEFSLLCGPVPLNSQTQLPPVSHSHSTLFPLPPRLYPS